MSAGQAPLRIEPPITPPPRLAARAWSPEEALVELVRGRLQGLGPVTGTALAGSLGLPARRVAAALAALEGEGFAMRGRFTPGLPAEAEEEWCERRLLARIHRATIDRLRREIDPVPAADFLRFLFAWQRVAPGEQAEGPESLAALVEQLEGCEVAAAAWEGEVLPARLPGYDPAWLDALCLSGRIAWGRFGGRSGRSEPETPAGRAAGAAGPGAETARPARRSGPIRTTPIALLGRSNLQHWRELAPTAAPELEELSGGARAVHDALAARGASFFGEIAAGVGLLHTQVEEALAELVAWGLATADSYAGLRALLVPSGERPRPGARGRRGAFAGMEHAGRWSLLPSSLPGQSATEASAAAVEAGAWVLLRRYGVVFRKLLERETLAPSWGELLRVYRRLEARGEIRGGRFVEGFSGEQYALPDAVGKLRALRRRPGDDQLVSLSAADPLNLAGVVTPGPKVPALAGNRVLFRDGVPVALYESRTTRLLVDAGPAESWALETALRKRTVPAPLKALLGRGA